MFLLDTNVVSELRKKQADRHVVKWANSISPASLYLSAITVLELETGVLRIVVTLHKASCCATGWNIMSNRHSLAESCRSIPASPSGAHDCMFPTAAMNATP